MVIMVTIVIMVVVILIITMVMIVILVVVISIITMCFAGLTTGMPLLPSYSLLSEVSIININTFSLSPLLTCNTSTRSPSSD